MFLNAENLVDKIFESLGVEGRGKRGVERNDSKGTFLGAETVQDPFLRMVIPDVSL